MPLPSIGRGVKFSAQRNCEHGGVLSESFSRIGRGSGRTHGLFLAFNPAQSRTPRYAPLHSVTSVTSNRCQTMSNNVQQCQTMSNEGAIGQPNFPLAIHPQPWQSARRRLSTASSHTALRLAPCHDGLGTIAAAISRRARPAGDRSTRDTVATGSKEELSTRENGEPPRPSHHALGLGCSGFPF